MQRLALAAALVCATAACTPGRYLGTIRHHAAPTPAAHEGDTAELDTLLEETRVEAEKHGLFGGIEERILLLLDGRAAWSVEISGGKATVHKGPKPGFVPTLTVPIVPQMVKNLRALVADGKIDDNELFNLTWGLYTPCLKRIHEMYYFRDAGDKSALGVDDYMQFRVKNPQGFTYHGVPVDIAVTVVNADGYFFYLPGHVGDPDVRYELAMDAALELYRLLVYDAERHKGSSTELRRIATRAKEILATAATYERSWH